MATSKRKPKTETVEPEAAEPEVVEEAVPAPAPAPAAVPLYASRETLLASQGPVVVGVTLPVSKLSFLVRRPNMQRLLDPGVVPDHLHSAVEKLATMGLDEIERSFEGDKGGLEELVLALMRYGVIVPPAELVSGQITEEEIRSSMCRPLFVAPGQTPTEEQLVLLPSSGDGQDAGLDGDTCQLSHGDLNVFLWSFILIRQGASFAFRNPTKAA